MIKPSSRLSRLKMPAGKGKGMELDMDLGAGTDDQDDPDAMNSKDEGSPEEEANESPAEESKELANVPDDALLAEIKKRGLMSKLAGQGSGKPQMSSASEDDDSY